jgi:hypothetical protein
MSSFLSFLLIPAIIGVIAYLRTRHAGTAAGWLAWSIALVVAFAVIKPWYEGNSHCEPPATYYVPFVGAFAAASGGWVGISRGRASERAFGLVRVALESAVIALLPGSFFLLMLWPCR